MPEDDIDSNQTFQPNGGDDPEPDAPLPNAAPQKPPPQWWQTHPGFLQSLLQFGDRQGKLQLINMMVMV